MCLLCADTPPSEVKGKGHGAAAGRALLERQGYPNEFAGGLKDMPCTQPLCCCVSSLGAPFGCTACWARKAVLEKFGRGIEDFVCCQGYLSACCCCDPQSCCAGSIVGLCLEGCCCPMLSLSVARIHLMESKQVRPDPMDWQIIACSNCLQCLSLICSIAAICFEQLEYAAHVVDCIADCVTCSVAGCMGAQVYHELNSSPGGPGSQELSFAGREVKPGTQVMIQPGQQEMDTQAETAQPPA